MLQLYNILLRKVKNFSYLFLTFFSTFLNYISLGLLLSLVSAALEPSEESPPIHRAERHQCLVMQHLFEVRAFTILREYDVIDTRRQGKLERFFGARLSRQDLLEKVPQKTPLPKNLYNFL